MKRKLVLVLAGMLGLSAALHAADWPMLSHDAARSGGTSDALRPPVQRKWYRDFKDEGLMNTVQPVIANGRLYIGTMRGTFYCLDAATGKDVWTAEIPGGVLHAAAVAAETVYVCSGRGKLHALDAATGRPRWTFDTSGGAAIWNAPLPWNNSIYFAGRDGVVYAVSAEDGTLKWTTELGAAVIQSPAIDPATGRLYIGAEDMRAYALDAASGKMLWKSQQLQGFTFAGYHPTVVPDGGVAFTTRPFASDIRSRLIDELMTQFYGSTTNDKNPDGKTQYPAVPNWRFSKEHNEELQKAAEEKLRADPQFWLKNFAFIREKMQQNPHYQTMFLLDGESGKSRGVVPVIFGESNAGTTSPPVVMADGKVVVKATAGLLFGKNTDYGYLDPKTADISLVKPPTDRFTSTGANFVNDEMAGITAAGPFLLKSAQFESKIFDTSGKSGWNGGQIVFDAPHGLNSEEKLNLPLRYLRGEPLPVGREFICRGHGVYGGGPGIDMPSPVVGDTLYFIPTWEGRIGACLIAYQSTEKQPPLKEPAETSPITDNDRKAILASNWDFDYELSTKSRGESLIKTFGVSVEGIPAPIGVPDPAGVGAGKKAFEERLAAMLFEAPSVAVTADAAGPLRQKLSAAVAELISADWAPLLFPEGQEITTPFRTFADPSELPLTIGMAWPYLPAELQPRVREYVNRHLQADEVLEHNYLDENAGQRREAYPVKTTRKIETFRTREPGLSRLYPLWLYAHASGDWQWIEQNWPAIKLLLNANPKASDWKTDGKNAYLSGLIAYCRIAAHMKDAQALSAAQPRAIAAMRERIEYEATMTRGGIYFVGAANGRGSGPARWLFLTPETARLCRSFTDEVQKSLVGRYIDYHRPTWYLAWGQLTEGADEECTALPNTTMAHYAAKAMLVDTPAEQLVQAVDIPWCKADLYYIQKLVLAIEAHGQRQWRSVK